MKTILIVDDEPVLLNILQLIKIPNACFNSMISQLKISKTGWICSLTADPFAHQGAAILSEMHCGNKQTLLRRLLVLSRAPLYAGLSRWPRLLSYTLSKFRINASSRLLYHENVLQSNTFYPMLLNNGLEVVLFLFVWTKFVVQFRQIVNPNLTC